MPPIYPKDEVQNRKHGVCVVSIILDANGRVTSVQALETPTISMFNSVAKAVAQWTFKPFKSQDGEPILMSGRLTFYFEIKNGKGLVLDPKDAGYVGTYPVNKTN